MGFSSRHEWIVVRVLLVSDFFPPVRGGLETHVDVLAANLCERGHSVAVATLTENPVARHPDVHVYTIPAAATRLLPHADKQRPFHPPLPDPVAHRALGEVLRDFRPSVVHGHSWLTVSVPRRPNVPTVLTAHDYGWVCQLRTLLRPDDTLCGGPSARCLPCGAARYGYVKSAAMSIGTPLGRRSFHPTRVLAVSESVRQAVIPAFGSGVQVVPNFVADDSPRDDVDAPGLPDVPFVMFAGDPSHHKGIDVLLDCWRGADAPNADLVLAVTKDFDRVLPARVRTVRLAHEQMKDAWTRAHVAIVPSLWADPFPTVALEAMAAGTAIVASRLGGLVDMLDDGVQGFLIAPGDAAAIVASINRLLADQELRLLMGEAARHRVQRFAASSVVPDIERIYEEIQ
ncbi:MAG TPA: glycosyltransferase family 4 protein [Acidothermaceae bacterium]|jgi:glycogen(starch) synthase|nr:glycosyltransferase family 4 protein [Acidothermaceae bacterium]